MSTLNVFTDGSITGGAWGSKSGPATVQHAWAGWIVKLDEELVKFHSVDMGEGEHHSGNTAEHFAVSSALCWISNYLTRQLPIRVYTDSRLIVGHLSGEFNIHNERLRTLAARTRELAKMFPLGISYRWIAREENREADFVSKCLQQKYGGRIPTVEEFKAKFPTAQPSEGQT